MLNLLGKSVASWDTMVENSLQSLLAHRQLGWSLLEPDAHVQRAELELKYTMLA